jgi:hypothetical protein
MWILLFALQMSHVPYLEPIRKGRIEQATYSFSRVYFEGSFGTVLSGCFKAYFSSVIKR